MNSKTLSLVQLLDLIQLENSRGIISGNAFMQTALGKGIPRVISDVRGAVRLEVEREGEDFLVTQYQTDLARETVGAVY